MTWFINNMSGGVRSNPDGTSSKIAGSHTYSVMGNARPTLPKNGDPDGLTFDIVDFDLTKEQAENLMEKLNVKN